MTEQPNEPDDLGELLTPPATAETPGLREAVLRRTHRRLAFGRWSRRAAQAAGAVAVFVAGAGLGVWQSPRERETILVPTSVPQIEVVAVPVLVPLSGTSAEQSPVATRNAKALELDAELADGIQAATLYRQAGDAYLTTEQDYANAARCYRLFLTRGGDNALSPEPGDSWLLTSLKNAAFKEKVHATSTNG